MDIGAIINWVTQNYGQIVLTVLAILGAFSTIAKLTPTKVDDEFVQKLLDIIHSLGLTKGEAKK
ncbi:MAG TPA: hypothetical protein VD998_03745 [Verrucomicrobiae bacterium]|nr:hypothetical protein [Verrucomicrobiae bacterium]